MTAMTNPLLRRTHTADVTALTMALRHTWTDEETLADAFAEITGGELTAWYPVADDLIRRGLMVRRVAATTAGLPAYTEVAATDAGAYLAGARPLGRPAADPASADTVSALRSTFDAIMAAAHRCRDTGDAPTDPVVSDFLRWAGDRVDRDGMAAALDAYSQATAERIARR